jgi:hypothetical protein
MAAPSPNPRKGCGVWHKRSTSLYPPGVCTRSLRRGGPFTVAVTTVAALGALPHVDTPRPLMDDVGLPPSASSRGPRRRQGAMTNAGHLHARRALVAGAWASRDPATVSRHVHRRCETPPHVSQEISWKAQVRRCTRDRKWLACGKHANPGVVAMARALVGFLWAMAQEVTVTPSGHRMDGPCTHEVARFRRASEEPPPRCGVTLVGVTRPLGHTRASREAGTRRTPVRWDPIHG